MDQRVVVVTTNHERTTLTHQIDALARVGPITDDVSEADHFLDPAGIDIGEHRLEPFEIPMDVRDYRSLRQFGVPPVLPESWPRSSGAEDSAKILK